MSNLTGLIKLTIHLTLMEFFLKPQPGWNRRRNDFNSLIRRNFLWQGSKIQEGWTEKVLFKETRSVSRDVTLAEQTAVQTPHQHKDAQTAERERIMKETHRLVKLITDLLVHGVTTQMETIHGLLVQRSSRSECNFIKNILRETKSHGNTLLLC